MMKFEKESKKLEDLVKLDSKLPSIEELELKMEKASRELEKKDEKFEVSFILSFMKLIPK